jgi:hypothetical protein
MRTTSEPTLREAEEQIDAVVEEIKPHLANRHPAVQGAALANLLAIFLVGHRIEGDSEATHELRMQCIEMHMKAVAEYIPIYEAEMFPTRQ